MEEQIMEERQGGRLQTALIHSDEVAKSISQTVYDIEHLLQNISVRFSEEEKLCEKTSDVSKRINGLASDAEKHLEYLQGIDTHLRRIREIIKTEV